MLTHHTLNAQVGRYSMDFYMDEAKRVVDAYVDDPSHPMFLYFAHQEQHVPLQVLASSPHAGTSHRL
jgi:hypothetical protein